VRREWEPEDLIASWTLLDDDWRLVGNKTGVTRLSFAVILKFFAIEARFSRRAGEVPKAAVDYVAGQVRVDPTLWGGYAWSGRSIERHRAQIREELGFREVTRDDEQSLIEWLAAEICPVFGGVEVRSGSAGARDAVGGDRQAGTGQGDRVAGGCVRGVFRETGDGLAGPRGGQLPIGFAG
jgi:hypothetical protein